jgi:hypothetical protein
MMRTAPQKQLGQLLLDERLVDRLELDRALSEQRHKGGRLGDR